MKKIVYRENLGTLHQRRINKSPPQNPRTPIKFYKENGIWFLADNAPLSIIYLHHLQNVKFGSIVSRDAIWFLQKRESNLTQIWSKNQIRFSRTMRTIWSDQNFLWNVQNLINFFFKKCIFVLHKMKKRFEKRFRMSFFLKKVDLRWHASAIDFSWMYNVFHSLFFKAPPGITWLLRAAGSHHELQKRGGTLLRCDNGPVFAREKTQNWKSRKKCDVQNLTKMKNWKCVFL